MKKFFMVVVFVVASGLSAVYAAEEKEAASPSAYIQIPVVSAYNWRGQIIDNRPVFQPYISITRFGFTASAWANLSINDKYTGKHDFSEVDLTLSYLIPVSFAEISIGAIDYLPTAQDADPLHEMFVTAKYPNNWITPRVEAYRSFDDYVGYYLLVGLSRQFALGEKLTLAADVSSGFGSTRWNIYSFGVDDGCMNDGAVSLGLKYAFTDTLSLTPTIKYAWLWDSDIKEGAHNTLPAADSDSDMLIGSISLDYSF